MLDKKTQQAGWEKVWKRANLLDRIVGTGRKFYNRRFLSLLLPYLKKGSSFAEVGCGTGSLLSEIAGTVALPVGIDISSAALRSSEARNASLVKGDCFKLPFKSNAFDVVWSQGLLEHFDDPKKILREHARICKKGGDILISVPYKYSYMLLWWHLTRVPGLGALWPWTHQEFYTADTYQKLTQGMKFRSRGVFLLGIALGVIILHIRK